MAGYGLGAQPKERLAEARLIREAVERGIRYIDTAVAYNDAEDMLGEMVGYLEPRKVRICTKLRLADLPGGVAASCKRLRSRRVDTVMLHGAGRDDILNAAVGIAFAAAKASSCAVRTGASTYGVENALLASEQPWCNVLQVEYSLLNPSVVQAIAPSLRAGQELVARSVLCKGLLTERRRYVSEVYPQAVRVVDEIERLATRWGFTLPGLAIRFALDTPRVNVVLVGISNKEELETALRVLAHQPLTAQQMKALAEFDCSGQDAAHPERWVQLPTA